MHRRAKASPVHLHPVLACAAWVHCLPQTFLISFLHRAIGLSLAVPFLGMLSVRLPTWTRQLDVLLSKKASYELWLIKQNVIALAQKHLLMYYSTPHVTEMRCRSVASMLHFQRISFAQMSWTLPGAKGILHWRTVVTQCNTLDSMWPVFSFLSFL